MIPRIAALAVNGFREARRNRITVVVAAFEVLFLYRELVDAITPWMAQQGFNLGIVGTLALAFAGWLGAIQRSALS